MDPHHPKTIVAEAGHQLPQIGTVPQRADPAGWLSVQEQLQQYIMLFWFEQTHPPVVLHKFMLHELPSCSPLSNHQHGRFEEGEINPSLLTAWWRHIFPTDPRFPRQFKTPWLMCPSRSRCQSQMAVRKKCGTKRIGKHQSACSKSCELEYFKVVCFPCPHHHILVLLSSCIGAEVVVLRCREQRAFATCQHDWTNNWCIKKHQY